MALTIGGTPVKSVYVGNTPVTAVYVGSQKIWPVGPQGRTVTVVSSSPGPGFVWSAAGDIDMVDDWPSDTLLGRGVAFSAPVTCNQIVKQKSGVTFTSGSTIPAGTGIYPSSAPPGTPHVFTEVL